jgi:nitrile hydratase accessory protein
MAVALNEADLFHWEEFKQELISRVSDAELNEEKFDYFHIWLATFEHILRQKGIVSPDELKETAFQFEFGERDEVY